MKQQLKIIIFHILRYPPSLARASILKRARLLAISCRKNEEKLVECNPGVAMTKQYDPPLRALAVLLTRSIRAQTLGQAMSSPTDQSPSSWDS